MSCLWLLRKGLKALYPLRLGPVPRAADSATEDSGAGRGGFPGPPRSPGPRLRFPVPGSGGGWAPGGGRRVGQAPNLYWGELLAVGAMGVDLRVGRGAAQTPDPGEGPGGGPQRWSGGGGRVTCRDQKVGHSTGQVGWRLLEVGNPDQLQGPPRWDRSPAELRGAGLASRGGRCYVPGAWDRLLHGCLALGYLRSGKPRDPARRS